MDARDEVGDAMDSGFELRLRLDVSIPRLVVDGVDLTPPPDVLKL